MGQNKSFKVFWAVTRKHHSARICLTPKALAATPVDVDALRLALAESATNSTPAASKASLDGREIVGNWGPVAVLEILDCA